MAYRSKKEPARAGSREQSNRPRSVAKSVTAPKLKIESDSEGQIRTFDASTGTHKWLRLIRVK